MTRFSKIVSSFHATRLSKRRKYHLERGILDLETLESRVLFTGEIFTPVTGSVTITQNATYQTITDGTQTVNIPVSSLECVNISSGSANEVITIDQSGGAVTIPWWSQD